MEKLVAHRFTRLHLEFLSRHPSEEASCTWHAAPPPAGLATLVQLIQSALGERHGVQADSILLVKAMQLPTAPDGQIRRGACRWQYLDGDLDALAEWHAPESAGPTCEPRETNVVELAEGVLARRQRVSHS